MVTKWTGLSYMYGLHFALDSVFMNDRINELSVGLVLIVYRHFYLA